MPDQDLSATLARITAENERLQRARIGDSEIIGMWMCRAEAAERDGPPGEWICQTCGFRLTKAILRARDGAVGVDASEVEDICPNDGTSMRRVTWKEDAESANRVGLEMMKRNSELEATVQAQTEQIEQLRQQVAEVWDACAEAVARGHQIEGLPLADAVRKLAERA